MDPVKEIAELKARRDSYDERLAQPSLDRDSEIAIHHCIAAIDGQITMWGARLPPPPPRRKVVKLVDENGDVQACAATEAWFDRWLDGGALVPVSRDGGDGATMTRVVAFEDIDEAATYRRVHC
jgi:hypothetical protein